MKLEVGQFVRTDKGFISQITDFKEHCTKGKRLVDSYSTKEVVENYLSLKGNQCEFIESIDYSIPPTYPSDEELEKIKSHIVKASYDIIDLIEVGDYVNGSKVYYCYCADEDSTGLFIDTEKGRQWLDKPSQIKTVVTKEQFESMRYVVNE